MTEIEWMDIFSANIVGLLEEHNMSQSELAYIAGLSEGTISKYIHKQQMPTVKAAINIANAFNVDISDLVDFGESIY